MAEHLKGTEHVLAGLLPAGVEPVPAGIVRRSGRAGAPHGSIELRPSGA